MAGAHARAPSLTENDVPEIRQATADWELGRSATSKTLCRRRQWRQANGQLKDMACRSLLLALEKKGELMLPPVCVRVTALREERTADRKSVV